MSFARKKQILPGFGLSLGFTLFYLALIVLIPLSAVFLKTATMSFAHFWDAISAPRVVATYRLSFGASLIAAAVNEQVRADNVDLGGGRGELAGQEQAIRTLAGAHPLVSATLEVVSRPWLPLALLGEMRARGAWADRPSPPRRFVDRPESRRVKWAPARSRQDIPMSDPRITPPGEATR